LELRSRWKLRPRSTSSRAHIAGRARLRARPDYTFRVNGQTRFFVEAKAPSADLADTDAEIDSLVGERYGLTADERKIIEESAAKG
jgi:hypothetical protein